MSTEIRCPNCQHTFAPGDAIREEVEKETRAKVIEWQKQKTAEFETQLEKEKVSIREQIETNLRDQLKVDYEVQLQSMAATNQQNEEKLKAARDQQLEYLRKEQALKAKEEELEITLQKKLLEARESLASEIRKQEDQRVATLETDFQLKMKEMKEQLEAQRKLAEEMKRKAEQGSMQSQGEAQELLLEELLKSTFPFDLVEEVGKGVRGADCIQTVRNPFAQDCGKIIFESKRTKDFSADWIEKIKNDMRSQGAEVAVIVSQALPKDMNSFGQKEGVWICTFQDVRAVVQLLREALIRIFNATKSQENKGDKMHLLYDYLNSREFGEQWQAIREGFLSMRNSIQRERDAMEKLWKQREKQLEKVLLNAAHIRGSIEGISGNDVNLNLLEDGEEQDV
ncbi:MAG: DUF2130 domain-containing protein [Bacteroidetes bacterium]|nr:DUF2130 domain-containing protein [Bacteroidota bacterium]